MSLKIAFLLFACCTLVMGYSIDSRVKRQAVSTDQRQGSNTGSTSDDGNYSSDSDSNVTGSGVRNGLREYYRYPVSQGMGNRFRNAFNRTYGEERNSVADSWNNVKDLMIQRIQTGANLTKSAFDLGTVVPKFGKNLILSSNRNEDEQ